MSETQLVADDPFSPALPDETAELEALARALELVDGFALLFASCNQAAHRDRLMTTLCAHLPHMRIQRVGLLEPVSSLLAELQARLESPAPDALFVYGVEAWLPSGEEAERSPFILNLNAARNHFPSIIRCPLVLWLPQHLLAALARGAPDFCSVRSGLYSFCAPPQALERAISSLSSLDVVGVMGLPYDEKVSRSENLGEMLAEFEALPSEFRDPLAEARLLTAQATIQRTLGHYREAEPLYHRALTIKEAALGPGHLNTATTLNDLGTLLSDQGRLAEAEPLLRRALAIKEAALGFGHHSTAASLSNLATLLRDQGRLAEAEPLLRRALEICEAALGPDHPSTATSLSNWAGLLRDERRLAESEPLYRRALAIYEAALGHSHPITATGLNNLGALLRDQGRLAEAEPLLRRALEICEAALGPDHPNTVTSLGNLSLLLSDQGRLAEAEALLRRVGDAPHLLNDGVGEAEASDHIDDEDRDGEPDA